MKYLITGGAGFIGSHLTQRLLSAGNKVTVCDLRRSTITGATYVRGDVMDGPLVETLVKTHDAVFHLAAVVGFANVMDDPTGTITTSLYGTGVVLHACYEHKKRVLLTSTSAVYGKTANGGQEVRETDPCLMGNTGVRSWSYAYAKAADECLAMAYHQQHKVPAIVARVFNTVGARQSADAGFVLPRFVEQALAEKPMTVHAPGDQTRTFCHVTDTVDGLARLMECDRALGEVVNIGGTETISMWDLALTVRQHVESPSPVHLVEHEYGPGYDNVEDRRPNLEKAYALFRYVPKYTLADMIQDVVEEHMERMAA